VTDRSRFDPALLEKTKHGDRYIAIVEQLEKDDGQKRAFLKACFLKLGLQVNQNPEPVPSLSPLHLSSSSPHGVSALLPSWRSLLSRSASGQVTLAGDSDTFHLRNLPASLAPDPDLSALRLDSHETEEVVDQDPGSSSSAVDYDKIAKHLILHVDGRPSLKETPAFNHALFYDSLARSASYRRDAAFGRYILYGDVVTSTSTLLERNDSLLRTLPSGFTATASTQLSGRGRGSNVWASPRGSLMFSTVIHHPARLAHSSPVVFVQYLAAVAVARAARRYGKGYAELPVRIKWPNDVYAATPDDDGGGAPRWAKVAGVLVTSSYAADSSTYRLLVGVGVNVANAHPTTGLDAVARAANLAPFTREVLLASILAELEDLHRGFCARGWDARLEDEYLSLWLHGGQDVTVESAGGLRARIRGVTRDWGLLLAEELDHEGRETGHMVALQSDSNSFDFFKGLIKRKV
jgi:biotin--protein ligase